MATQNIRLSNTAESNATSRYIIVPERFGQNEDRASRNEEWARKKPSFVPSSGFNRCNMQTHVILKLSIIYKFFIL